MPVAARGPQRARNIVVELFLPFDIECRYLWLRHRAEGCPRRYGSTDCRCSAATVCLNLTGPNRLLPRYQSSCMLLRPLPNVIFWRLVGLPSFLVSVSSSLVPTVLFFFFLSPVFSAVKLPVGVGAWPGVLVALLGESESLYVTEDREKTRSVSLTAALRRPMPPSWLPDMVPAEAAPVTADALMYWSNPLTMFPAAELSSKYTVSCDHIWSSSVPCLW